MRATTPPALAAGLDVLDGLGAGGGAVVVFRVLGAAVPLGRGAVVRLVCSRGRGAVVRVVCLRVAAFGFGEVVFPALGFAGAVFAGAVFAGAGEEGSPSWPAFQGRPQFASSHQSFLFHELSVGLSVALLALVSALWALSDRSPAPSGQSVQAMAADGMPTTPTATAAMTIRL
ncbi:hypothetical protein ABZ619_28785 [Streptomyces sp. NPDC007851]|uniref:hypothetical protein n=1 Tax=Streptomyces sp. NPDC007851 TaxID=3155008 RepID=UPI003405EE65